MTIQQSSHSEPTPPIASNPQPQSAPITPTSDWYFRADGRITRLVSEAYRFRMAHLVNPFAGVHSSVITPLPHQLAVVYSVMLHRQPLRFLLADDMGTGRLVTVGLFLKERMARKLLDRCLLVCPGNRVEQWQEEMAQRFQISFEIIEGDQPIPRTSGNVFRERPFLIARLETLSKDLELQERMADARWDLVICEQAHTMVAFCHDAQVRHTRRYELAKRLSGLTRDLLLITPRPHPGNEVRFHLFLLLLDEDRFEGCFREPVERADVSDLIWRTDRRDLVGLEGRPLLPELRLEPIRFSPTQREVFFNEAVEEYVKHELDRLDQLDNEGRKDTISYAFQLLQRAVSSSPNTIAHVLSERRRVFEQRLQEGGGAVNKPNASISRGQFMELTDEDFDDLASTPEAELALAEELLMTGVTGATTWRELLLEVDRLRQLEVLAGELARGSDNTKLQAVTQALTDFQSNFAVQEPPMKLVVIAEFSETVQFIQHWLRSRAEFPRVDVLHSRMSREERSKARIEFATNPEARILIASRALFEGINAIYPDLLILYDLPWNPEQLDRRVQFGQKIGSTKPCLICPVISETTSDGLVFSALFERLLQIHQETGIQVLGSLHKLISPQALQSLIKQSTMMAAASHSAQQLRSQLAQLLECDRLHAALRETKFAYQALTADDYLPLAREYQRSRATRLHPHYLRAFFTEAVTLLGGKIEEREPGRFEITKLPPLIYRRCKSSSAKTIILSEIQRAYFKPALRTDHDLADSMLITSGSPLFELILDTLIERHWILLRQGTIYVDDLDSGEELRTLLFLQHEIHDGRLNHQGDLRVLSRELQFVEIDRNELGMKAGPAPYLDYREITSEESALVNSELQTSHLLKKLKAEAQTYSTEKLVPHHLARLKQRREQQVGSMMLAIYARMKREITFWSTRVAALKSLEPKDKATARQRDVAMNYVNHLEYRLKRRLKQLKQDRQIIPRPPIIISAALIVPAGLIRKRRGESVTPSSELLAARISLNRAAFTAVLDHQDALGVDSLLVTDGRQGYDLEVVEPHTGVQKFIMVKACTPSTTTINFSYNQLLAALNLEEDLAVAIVIVQSHEPGDPPAVPTLPAAVLEQAVTIRGCSIFYRTLKLAETPDFFHHYRSFTLPELIDGIASSN